MRMRIHLCCATCFWFLIVSTFLGFCLCNQTSDRILCIPKERSALMQFKNNLTDPSNRLSSWVGKDCCRWSGVVCDNFTGHVQEIHLRGPDDEVRGRCHGPYENDDELEEATKLMLGGTISPSLLSLQQLKYLDLSCNDFGFTPIPSWIGSFRKLTYLNISKSQFDGEIPFHLGNLSTLHVLDLNGGLFTPLHSKSLKWVKNLKSLRHLDMGNINLAKVLDWFQVISSLSFLEELHFSSCELTPIPSYPTTVNFTSLMVLDLSRNIFDILLPGWIFSLHNLTTLDLTECNIYATNPEFHGGFHNMPSLRTLRVSRNAFMNSSGLLNGLPRLTNLSILDLSNCNLSVPIIGNLRNLSFIVHLDLSNNRIVEEIPKSLPNLCNLITLDLQANIITGNVSELLEGFCECESPRLELLAFRGNYLDGQLPEKLGRLKNLGSIDIAYNNLTGTIPNSLGSLTLLKTFQFNINQLSGSIPDTIGNLTSLNFLDLSFNNLSGSIPKSIGRLGELTFLTLHHNSLTGTVTEDHFANLTSLTTLWVGDNKLAFKLNSNNWIPPFQLEVLRIGSCSLGPRFPSWIRSQTSLQQLDISNANISDTIPKWIWTTFSNLNLLNMSQNNIRGKLGNVSFLAPGAVVDLSDNHFHGPLPGNFSIPDLDFLDLSYNNLSGSLYHFLCSGIQETRLLRVLNLAANNMSGSISECWMNWESLVILNLEQNQFSGSIPSSLGNISSLLSLDLRNNLLSGNLPVSLLNSKSLIIIELAENELTGRIPTSIEGDNKSLKLLSLRSNKFEGKIPNEICLLGSIQILDLADNDLSGSIPTCFTNFSVISGRETLTPIVLYDELFQNQVLGSALLVTKGRISSYSSILYLLITIDLSSNKFSGSIPDELITLLGLRFLNLSQNDLTGRIPNMFSNMGKLESLDLSLNHLDGTIPTSLAGLTSLNDLNLSYNNLTGRIPTGPQFITFGESSFNGNSLCGAPLVACDQPNNDDTNGTNDEQDEQNKIDWILVIFTIVGLFLGFWITVLPLIISTRWRNTYYRFFLDQSLKLNLIKLRDFILLGFPCLRRGEQPREIVFDQVEQLELSQYIFNHPKGLKQHGSFEASSSTHSIQPSDLSQGVDDQKGLQGGSPDQFDVAHKSGIHQER